MLKYYVIAIVLTASATESRMLNQQDKEIVSQCAKENNLTQKDFEERPKDVMKLPDNMICFLKCTLEKSNKITDDGKVKEDAIQALLKEFHVTKDEETTALDCMKKVSIKKCEDGRKILECLPKM